VRVTRKKSACSVKLNISHAQSVGERKRGGEVCPRIHADFLSHHRSDPINGPKMSQWENIPQFRERKSGLGGES